MDCTCAQKSPPLHPRNWNNINSWVNKRNNEWTVHAGKKVHHSICAPIDFFPKFFEETVQQLHRDLRKWGRRRNCGRHWKTREFAISLGECVWHLAGRLRALNKTWMNKKWSGFRFYITFPWADLYLNYYEIWKKLSYYWEVSVWLSRNTRTHSRKTRLYYVT